jgi:DNA-directed RNA polymerase specialized sigma24 family protein
MGSEPLYNERQLLLDVANGDEAAFRNLFNGYRDRLYAYSLKITSTREMAEDIVQDTLLIPLLTFK